MEQERTTPPQTGSKPPSPTPPLAEKPVTKQQTRTPPMGSSTPPLAAKLVTEQQMRTHPMGSKAQPATQPLVANPALQQHTRTHPMGSKALAPSHSLVANWLSTSHQDQKRLPRLGQAINGDRTKSPIMEEQRKIHPVAAEAKADSTKPLAANGLPKSVHTKQQQQRNPSTLRPPMNPPILFPNLKKKRSCLCRCICLTVTLVILIVVALGVTVGILYAVFRPKVPNYSVDSLRISDLRLNFDLSLYARFNVKITATNPNEKIGIYYQKGSRLSVWYSKTKLCQGTLPVFYQGHRNTTRLDVALSGQNQFGSTLMSALQQQQQTGRIPLDLKVDVPVRVKLGTMKLRKVRILGTCLLIVDSLSANTLVSIKASTCKFRVKL